MNHLKITFGFIEDQIIKLSSADVVDVAVPVTVVAHSDFHQVQAVDPVQVAHGDGREGHGGRRDERVGGDRREETVIIDYDDKTSHGEDGTRHENRKPV